MQYGERKDLGGIQMRMRREPALAGGDVCTEPCRRLHAGRNLKFFENIAASLTTRDP